MQENTAEKSFPLLQAALLSMNDLFIILTIIINILQVEFR